MGLFDQWEAEDAPAAPAAPTPAIPEPAAPAPMSGGLFSQWESESNQPVLEQKQPVTGGLFDQWESEEPQAEAPVQPAAPTAPAPAPKSWGDMTFGQKAIRVASAPMGAAAPLGEAFMGAVFDVEPAADHTLDPLLEKVGLEDVEARKGMYEGAKSVIRGTARGIDTAADVVSEWTGFKKGGVFGEVADLKKYESDHEYYQRLQNKEGFGKYLEEVLGMAPQIASQVVASVATGGVGSGLFMGAQIAGLEYEDKINQGVDEKTARTTSWLSAMMQMPLEMIGLGIAMRNPIARKFIKGGMKRFVAGRFLGGASESLTEFLQSFPSEFWDRVAKDPEFINKVIQDPSILGEVWDKGYEQGLHEGAVAFPYGVLMGIGGAVKQPKPPGFVSEFKRELKGEKPVDILTGKETEETPESVSGRTDANQVLEVAAARVEGAIPEDVPPEAGPPAGGAPIVQEPGMMTPDDIIMQAEEGRAVEAEAAEALAPSAGLRTPEEQLVPRAHEAQIPGQRPAEPIYPAEVEPIYQAIPETHKAQIGTTEKQPVAPKKKTLTAEEMAELPQAELDKIPTEERARALLGDKATDAQVQRLADDAEKLKATQTVSDLEVAEEGTDKSPSQADIETDSYDQGEFNWEDFNIAIETPKGTMRSGTDRQGKKWSQRMNVDYGKMKGIQGADGEEMDIAFRRSKKPDDYKNVYIVDQVDPATGEFDEHKIYIGYGSEKQARMGYLSNYEAGWKGLGNITTMSVAQFKKFVKKMDPKKPVKGQATITKDEWLSNPDMRPEGYDKAEYRPGATGKVAKVVNATIEKEYETWAEGQEIKVEKPAPKEDAELFKRVKSRLKMHRPWLKKGGIKKINVANYKGKNADELRIAKKIADALGVNLMVIRARGQKLALNGVHFPTERLVVLNADSVAPIISTFMHEATHAMKRNDNLLYKALEKYLIDTAGMDSYLNWVDSYLDTSIRVQRYALEKKLGREPTEAEFDDVFKAPGSDTLRSEFAAYTVGVLADQQSFWNEMALNNPGMFAKVSAFIKEFFDTLKSKIAKYSDIIKFDDNIAEVNRYVANAFEMYAQANKQAMEIYTDSQRIDAADISEVSGKKIKAPKKTRTVYKLFRTLKTRPGELFPLFIGKTEPVAMGEWIEAKFIPTKGFAQRPGWHAGAMPIAGHLMKKDGTMADDRVWAEVEVPADVDWQKRADANKSGDIKNEIPKGGHYRFARTKFQGTEWVIAGAIKVNKVLTQKEVDAINKTGEIEADIEVSETDDANTIALNAISGLADGKTTITIDDKKVGARPIIESIGFIRQGKSNKYKFDERIPKDADIIAGMYQAAWHVDLKTKGTTKELFGQITERLGRIQREGLGEKEQSDDQKKLRNYLNESRLTYREAAEATDRGNQLPTKNVLVRPKGVESGKGRQLLVQISSDFRAEEASHIGDPYYEALYEKRQGYNRPSRDFWELPEWMTRLAYFMPESDVYVIRSLEEAKAFFNQAEYDNIFFSVLDTNKRFVKDIAQNYKGDIIAGGYLPDGSYYKGLKNVSWMGNMEDAAKKVGVPFKNGVDYRHFKNSKTIPRLEMSRGCLHKCAFCSQERKLKMATPAEIDSQIKEFKAFDYELVYLNDKTFGQAENYTQLIEVKEKLQKANPKFKGFIIQTTAGQFLKMPTDFLNESGIIFVELGVETFNDKFLRSLKKPHTTKLIEQATKKIRDLNMVFVPNVMVGLTGKNKDGSRWVETKETYANTMAFFKKNQDIISHFNIGVLAAETGTELQKQLDDWQEVDTDEATMNRSWIKNKDVHEKYYYDLAKMGIEQLEDTNVASYVEDATIIAHGKLPMGEYEVLFDLEVDENEGKKGTATGGLLYWNVSEIAKKAGGWDKIGEYLSGIKSWKGVKITPAAVKYIGNLGTKLSKDVKLRNKTIAIEDFRKKLSSGKINEYSKEYKDAVKKYGAGLQLFSLKRRKRFFIGVNTIYGPSQKSDITQDVTKQHAIFGEFDTKIVRDKKFKLVMDTPILPAGYQARQDAIDDTIKRNEKYLNWYDDWNSFIKSFKHLPEAKLVKYIKMMAVFSAGSGPQGNMKQFTDAVNKLESGRELKSGSRAEGGDGIAKNDLPKIMAIWNDADPATTLEERRQIYGNKVGVYMHMGLFPRADGVVIDRHMPRLWGYDITWSPNLKYNNFRIMPQVEREIYEDIKTAADRNNLSTSAVQAALWYESRTPDVEASTYKEAAALKPSEYLPDVMHAALRTESLGAGKHFTEIDLKKGDFLLATKKDGSIEYNSFSRDDIGNRIYAHTDKNPYAELVYFYEAGTAPEIQLKGMKNVYTVDFNRKRIYDGIEDPMGYWTFAAERLKADPFASLTNIFSNLIEATGDFDGFITKAPVGEGRWILTFKEAEIAGVPENVVAGVSDVVDSIETSFPQTIKGISAIFNGRADKLYKKFRSLKGKYAEIKEEYFKPTVARFEGATQGKHEISGMVGMRGPLKAARAMMAEFGIANIQNNVILIHTEEGAERNGNFYRFKVKRDFESVEDIYKKIAEYGLEEYNISVSQTSGSFFIEQFVLDNAGDAFVKNFVKMINEITDKNFPQNITYRATSEILGDPDWTGVPAKALKHYRKNLVDYFGKKEGNERYVKAIKEAQIYKRKISEQIDPGAALFDIEEGGEGRRQDYGRAVEGQDVIGQFAKPGETMFDIEDATPGETMSDLWYSQLRRMVDSKKFPEKSSPKNMINIVESMARKGEVKQTELDWVGLTDWLDGIKGPVTKRQILEFLDKNNVKLEETVLGGSLLDTEAGRRVLADSMLDLYEQDIDLYAKPGMGNEAWGELADELADWVYNGTRDELFDIPILIDLFGGDRGLGEWIDSVAVENAETEYAQYTIDEEGSPEYREILISMKEPDLTAGALEALDWYYKKQFKKDPDGQKLYNAATERDKLSMLGKLPLYKLQKEGAPAYLVRQFKQWQNSPSFKIPHWPQKAVDDVVAHLRFDAKEIDGKRTIFIEEIQSDWAQRGRKVGYVDYTKAGPVGYHFVKQLQPDKTYVVYQLYEDSTGKLLAEGSMMDETMQKAGFSPGQLVKQTPFKMSKDWALLVLKRAVRYAAENGYEQIAWTGGQIQVDRYEEAFKKTVDTIYFNKKTGRLRAFNGGEQVFEKNLSSEKELPDYVGKDAAKKLIAGERHDTSKLVELRKEKSRLFTNLKGFFRRNTPYTPDDIANLLYPEMLDHEKDGWKLLGPEYEDIGDYVRNATDEKGNIVNQYRRFKDLLNELEQESIDTMEDGDSVVRSDQIIIDSKGMKGFYDEILPAAYNRFFNKKKWGNSKAEATSMDDKKKPGVSFYGGTDHEFMVKSGAGWKTFRGEEILTFINPTATYMIEGEKLGSKLIQDYKDILAGKQTKEGFSTAKHYAERFIMKAVQTTIGDMLDLHPIWMAPVTEKMSTKVATEGFPMFDIEEDSIPKESGAVLKEKIGRKEKGISAKIKDATEDFAKNWRTRMLDSLRPIADWFGEDSGAYMSHRGLPGVQSTLNAFMEHGKLQMLDDGSITTEGSGQGFLKWLNGLGQDAEKFLYWQIAKRSEVLTGEDRELLLTDSDRQKIYDWVGESPKSRDSWQEISDEFAEWNQNMLDLAVKAGLLTKEQIGTWQSDFYIPFYRIFEDEQARMEFVKGPAKNKKYISAQVKRLRGSESRIGDPMENIIKNWSALLGNSMFNNARREAFNYANDNNLMSGFTRINEETGEEEDVPVMEQIPWSKTVIFKPMKGGLTFIQEKTGEQVLAFKDGGKSVFFKVNDPELFGALAGINKEYFDNILMRVMSGSKRLLTLGATVTPAFRIANMLRDTLHTFQISDNFIPFWDTARGFIKIWKNDPEYAKFMASGHAFGGSYVRAEDPRAMKRYTDRIVKREGKGALSRILDTAEKMWAFWEAVGEASENAARVQLYINLKQKGKTHQQAAFAARDLMDFQMSGASGVVQFFIQTVPFLNARMQGLYKMGRSAALNPKAFLTKGAMISAASLALWLLYWDDDRYKELEDWEKFQYYHFWIGDKHFRIPKPFETGVIFSSSVESAANVMSGNDEISHVFNYLKHALLETFAFNPVPQVIRPATEIYMNKSFFTGRPIESMSKKRLRPGDRYDPWDSETLRLLGDKLNISPKKANTLIRGYTAALGMGVLALSDLMVRNIADFPERPSMDIGQYPAIGRFVKGNVSRYTKHMSKFYDLYNEVDELVATVNNYKRIGEFEKARDLAKANRKKLSLRKGLGSARKQLGDISLEMRRVWFSRTLTGAEKYERLQKLTERRNEIVKRIYDKYQGK